MYITIVFVSIFSAKILLSVVNLIHKPKEGTFFRHKSDKDYRYWSIRNTIKRWPIWLAHNFPFPFLDNICFKMFGVKTKFSNSLFEGWVDTEFIEFGKDIVVGQGSIIQSSVIIGNMLIIRKTTIEDCVRIGAHSVVMPGTHIRKNCILAASSTTYVGQELEEGWVYLGVPAKKYKENIFYQDNLEPLIEKQFEDIEKLHQRYETLYTKRHDKHEIRE
jgi:acetyltransferase-like isoleucine patch superfamily enzyme